jgi:pimeloyl-ACP methyl ester carboxylesterase
MRAVVANEKMTGQIIDTLRYWRRSPPPFADGFFYLDTDFGKVRVFDTKGNLPVIINVPDGPNVIEHQIPLIRDLSKNYRVICFEYPGLGFSYPNQKYDYTFKNGANVLMQVMDSLQVGKVALLFSCSNGYYAIQAGIERAERFNHIFLSQTPSIDSIIKWTAKSIPDVLKIPFVGQLANALFAKKLADIWYTYSLPKNHSSRHEYAQTAKASLAEGGCFCLSSLVQGLSKDRKSELNLVGVPTTLVWGSRDFTHRKTDKSSIQKHVRNCEIIEFEQCGHFPELENRTDYVKLIKEKMTK